MNENVYSHATACAWNGLDCVDGDTVFGDRNTNHGLITAWTTAKAGFDGKQTAYVSAVTTATTSRQAANVKHLALLAKKAPADADKVTKNAAFAAADANATTYKDMAVKAVANAKADITVTQKLITAK